MADLYVHELHIIDTVDPFFEFSNLVYLEKFLIFERASVLRGLLAGLVEVKAPRMESLVALSV
jgi:hypothetical protein